MTSARQQNGRVSTRSASSAEQIIKGINPLAQFLGKRDSSYAKQ